MTEITIFSSPKPFLDTHIARIQRNAISSWLQLRPYVEVILLGDEHGMEQLADELDIQHILEVERNEYGTPLISSIFQKAQMASSTSLMAYVNADIIVLPDFLENTRFVAQKLKKFLIVGSRIDLRVDRQLSFNDGWGQELMSWIGQCGRRHKPAGSDYFIFPKGLFFELPPFSLGRAGWDNWMIYSGRRRRIPVVDASGAILIVHQDHDYAHLPGGEPHYRQPESQENVQMAGGSEMIFTLRDTNWYIEPGKLRRKCWLEKSIIRSVEAWFYLRLGPGRASHIVRLLFHPLQTIQYLSKYRPGVNEK